LSLPVFQEQAFETALIKKIAWRILPLILRARSGRSPQVGF
jgi:hypothetical protein